MISHYLLSRRLQIEWNRLESESGQTSDFVKGMIRGLKLANAMLLEIWQAQKNVRQSNNPDGRQNTFAEAIITAHRQLKSIYRHNAVTTLGKVLVRAQNEVKRQEIQTGDK